MKIMHTLMTFTCRRADTTSISILLETMCSRKLVSAQTCANSSASVDLERSWICAWSVPRQGTDLCKVDMENRL